MYFNFAIWAYLSVLIIIRSVIDIKNQLQKCDGNGKKRGLDVYKGNDGKWEPELNKILILSEKIWAFETIR